MTDMAWMEQAACKDTPVEWIDFFPERKPGDPPEKVPEHIKRICAGCVVREECLVWAIDRDEEGVWAGTTKKQREALDRPFRRAKCPACLSTQLGNERTVQTCMDCGLSWTATKGTVVSQALTVVRAA